MLTPQFVERHQPLLFHEVHSDEEYLLNIIEGDWFQILYHFHWPDYCSVAADYYNALYDFNQRTPLKSNQTADEPEDIEHAKIRLLFDRVTAPNPQTPEPPVLYQGNLVPLNSHQVTLDEVAPGHVPARQLGRKPKCFFALFKAYIGTSLMGLPAEPEQAHRLLTSNPAFARVCGFFLQEKDRDHYHYQRVPSLRKLEQFDQIMTQAGLWAKIKLAEVKANLLTGVIKKENELVGDTTHYHAHSSFETVTYTDEKGKAQKKSQSKPTKPCGCDDWHACPHAWELGDEGAGTVVKSGKKIYWAHKASIIGLPQQGIPLDAIAVADAASHDGQTFYPHVEKVLNDHPCLSASVKRVLYDSACDDEGLKQRFWDDWGLELKASFNPRRAQPITENLPRGIGKITAYGNAICQAGHTLDYQGIRYANETFIYRAPIVDGQSVCTDCASKQGCCHADSQSSRTITVPFTTLKHINPNDPPMAKRFKAIMTRRPSVERMIKRLKCDLGDDRLSKRGNDAFQAYLDKTMISFHLLLRHLH